MSHREVARDDRFNHRQDEHSHFMFEGIDYPASKQDLVDFATDQNTIDADLLNLVRALPDRTYVDRDDIWRAWSEAMRKFATGNRNEGEPRDDMGKQKTEPGGRELEM